MRYYDKDWKEIQGRPFNPGDEVRVAYVAYIDDSSRPQALRVAATIAQRIGREVVAWKWGCYDQQPA